MMEKGTLLLLLTTLAGFSLATEAPCSNDSFSVNPADQVGDEGDRVTFHCKYTNPNKFFVWEYYQLNGKRRTIDGNNDIPNFKINTTNGDLLITSLRSNHSGLFACRATAFTGCSIFSENASLSIYGVPSIVIFKNNVSTISTGEVEISGFITGLPIATVSLRLKRIGVIEEVKDTRLNITHPSEFGEAFSITFYDLRLADGGQYYVVAVNDKGQSMMSVTINVEGPDLPIVTLPSFVFAPRNSTIEVTCTLQPSANQATGDTQLKLEWTNPGGAMMRQSFGERQLTLNIANLRSDTEGEYMCNASNVRGMDAAVVGIYATISLSEPPKVEDLGDGTYNISWMAPTLPAPNVPLLQYVVTIKRHDGTTYATQPTSNTYFTVSLPSGDQFNISVEVVLGVEGKSLGRGPPSYSTELVSVSESTSSDSVSLYVIVGTSVGGAIILLVTTASCLVIFFLCYYYPHKHKLSGQEQSWSKEDRLDETDQSLGNSYEPLTITLPPHIELPPSPTSPAAQNTLTLQYFNMDIDPKWEFPRENLQLSEVLCESQYTILYKGTARGIRDKPLEVSIKALRDNATEEEMKILFYEMDQLANVGPHHNIVSLLRVCTVGKPLYMVMEYMSHGDLLGFLRASRGHYSMYTVSPGFRNQQPPNLQLSSRDLLGIGSKIAGGMRFLADRKIVHRALCCKNVLVGSGMDIKVYNVGGYDLPAEVRHPLIKWMAPEVLMENTFTTHSDVWAFGVTLWELVTVGATPYAEINPEDLYPQLCGGMRMPRPLHCAQDVYDIMSACWEASSTGRPHFATIHDRLDNLSHSKMSLLNLRSYNDSEYSQFDEFPSQATAL